jgi:hypothetical protein
MLLYLRYLLLLSDWVKKEKEEKRKRKKKSET